MYDSEADAPIVYDASTGRHRFRLRPSPDGAREWHVYAVRASPSPRDASWRLVAYAATTAAHPTTVYTDEWLCRALSESTRGRVARGTFRGSVMGFAHEWTEDGPGSSPDCPVELPWLGWDYFERIYHTVTRRVSRVVWFRVPATGEVHHSGAKGCRDRDGGRRYCHRCRLCFSANNFVTQHLRTHPETAIRAVVSEPPWAEDPGPDAWAIADADHDGGTPPLWTGDDAHDALDVEEPSSPPRALTFDDLIALADLVW